jgi:hypothetical protein
MSKKIVLYTEYREGIMLLAAMNLREKLENEGFDCLIKVPIINEQGNLVYEEFGIRDIKGYMNFKYCRKNDSRSTSQDKGTLAYPLRSLFEDDRKASSEKENEFVVLLRNEQFLSDGDIKLAKDYREGEELMICKFNKMKYYYSSTASYRDSLDELAASWIIAIEKGEFQLGEKEMLVDTKPKLPVGNLEVVRG